MVRRDRHDFSPNMLFIRFDAVAMALRMGFVPTAGRRATSVSSSQFHPPRPPHLCLSRLFRVVCLRERLSTVLSDNRWLKAPLQGQLDLEERRCHRPLAARLPIPDSRDSRGKHLRGMPAIHLEPHTTHLLRRTPTDGGDPMRKITTHACHLQMCTENTTPADARPRLPARAAPHRSHSTNTRRTQDSSPATGPAHHVVIAPTLPSREATDR